MPADTPDPQADYPIELIAPDISAYKTGNTGVPYVTRFVSGEPGPHVLVNAVTHGNELCGAIALDYLFRTEQRPKRGTLTLSFANIDAYLSFDPANPDRSRFVDEDFNRLWDAATLDGPRQSTDLKRARILRPVVAAADYLLDIHSMQQATAPLGLSGTLPKGLALARGVGVPVLVVADEGHAAGRRMRDYADFGDPASPRAALLVECGQHWEKASADVAIESMFRFLAHLDVMDADFISGELARFPAPKPQTFVKVTDAVTVSTEHFEFTQPFIGLEVIAKAGTVIGHDGGRPVVTAYDDCMLIMPSRRLVKGQTAVRLAQFVS